MNKVKTAALIIVISSIFCGCDNRAPESSSSIWKAQQIKVITEGLNLPECAVIDPASGNIYVSNVVTPNEQYWIDDSNGFISLLNPDGTVKKLRWLESSPEMPINDPKGMTILDGKLYFNDNSKLKRCSLNEPGTVEIIELPETKKLNDLATDGKSIWTTDIATGNVFCIEPATGQFRQIQGPESINGITFHNRKLFAVSWDLHDIFELDPTGQKVPEPFGLATHFTNLDTIEILNDGTFIVSDYKGNKVCAVSSDRKAVTTLIELQSPADIALDQKNNLIYVPEMLVSRMAVIELKK